MSSKVDFDLDRRGWIHVPWLIFVSVLFRASTAAATIPTNHVSGLAHRIVMNHGSTRSSMLASAITLIDASLNSLEYSMFAKRLGPDAEDEYQKFRDEAFEWTGVYRVDPMPLRAALGYVLDAPEVRATFHLNDRLNEFTARVFEIWAGQGLRNENAIWARRRELVAPLVAALILAEETEHRIWTPIERHAFSLEVRRTLESLVLNYPGALASSVAAFRDLIYCNLTQTARDQISEDLHRLSQGHAMSGESRAKLKMSYFWLMRINQGPVRSRFARARKIMMRPPNTPTRSLQNLFSCSAFFDKIANP